MYRCFQNFLLGFFYLSSHPDLHDLFIWKVVRLIWKKKDITGRNFDIPGGVCAISSSMEHLRLDLFSGNSGNRSRIDYGNGQHHSRRSEERRVGKESQSRWKESE